MNVLSSAFKERPAVLVDSSLADQYEAPIPINPIYKPAFMAVYQQSKLKSMNVQIVQMTGDEAAKRSNMDVGVFEAKFGQWSCTLNWTEEKKGRLPPDAIGVDFGDVSCAILGPYLTIRTCWHCGMTGWKDVAKTAGCVESSYFDEPTGLWISRHCPRCYQTDWWARTIEPSRFWRDCCEAIVNRTKKKSHWELFGGTAMDDQIALEGGAVA